MPEKVTKMVLNVDLQCNKCSKKVKKILSKFPGEIQDQTYDEKQNTVSIKVVSCCPEKLRDKLCRKGGGSIKSIEIKPPEKPMKEPEKKKESDKPKEPEKKKEPEKTTEPEKKKEPEKTTEPGKKKVTIVEPAKSPSKPPVPVLVPAPGYPPYYPFGVCCPECYWGHGGGPCYHVGGPILCYDGYCGRPVYDSWGGGGAVCSIM